MGVGTCRSAEDEAGTTFKVDLKRRFILLAAFRVRRQERGEALLFEAIATRRMPDVAIDANRSIVYDHSSPRSRKSVGTVSR